MGVLFHRYSSCYVGGSAKMSKPVQKNVKKYFLIKKIQKLMPAGDRLARLYVKQTVQ